MPGNMAEYRAPTAGGAPPAALMAEAHPGRLFKISATVWVLIVPAKAEAGFPEVSLVKLPDWYAVVGTDTGLEEIPFFVRRPSYEAKKKVLSLLIGPPNVPPNWF